ncbi:MAG: chemotaxis response regulator protein-glutamate methylesterase [Desulfocurvibacter africanus]
MIRVVVIDDSAFMRKAISTMLAKDPEIQVVGTAHNGNEGIERIRELDPDVVTLDIEMPVMDGLTALRRIMMEMPRPVIMVSSLTTEGAEATLKAMELGAVDFISKELSKVSLDIIKIEADLQKKVKAVAKRKLRHRTPLRPMPRSAESHLRERIAAIGGRPVRDIVAIGVSTGGPPAVQKVLSSLPVDFPAAVLIAQHMPPAFTGPFAKRLDNVCAISVKEAEDGEPLKPGTVYIAPGGKHLKITQRGTKLDVVVSPDPAGALYKPSVNVLISSVAETLGRRALGVILTGMGNDGLEGIRELKARGGRVLAQNDATCVVYGMPKAIVDAGLADRILGIDEMGPAIISSLYEN